MASTNDNYSNGNGHYKGPWKTIGKESLGLGVAEVVSIGASLGVIAVADQIAPGLMKGTTQFLARAIVEPYLDAVEGTLGAICKLEECKSDKTKPRAQRAEDLAHAIVLFSPSFVAGLASKIVTRRVMNHVLDVKDSHQNEGMLKFWKLSSKEKIIMGADETTHIGSLILLNTGAAKYTDDLIRGSSSVLQKIGISEKKAKDLSSMAMIWELPNAIGLMAGIGGIVGVHRFGIDKKFEKIFPMIFKKSPLEHSL